MRIDKNHWLLNRPIAHRGLWGGQVIENSLPAYQNAIDNNFPIEIDLYSSNDGEIFCFHDFNLARMTGENSLIYQNSSKQLKKLRLQNSNHQIPTFEEVLSLVNGKVPLLIEFKNQPNKSYVQKAVDILKSYNGQFAVQSFNPMIIKKIKSLAPEFIRGILTTKTHSKGESKMVQFILKNMPFNFIIKPDFISCAFEDLSLVRKKAKTLPVIAWTIESQNVADGLPNFVSNYIFENFMPNK